MRDFRQSLPLMRSFRRELHWSDDSPELRRAMRRVLARIRSEGPLKARDFENREVRVPGSWTFSKVEKRAIPKSEKTSVARQKLIHDFLRALRSRLDQILKRPDAVKISLHGRDAVSFEDLRSDLSSSGVFLGFLTREYVRSKWFEEEFTEEQRGTSIDENAPLQVFPRPRDQVFLPPSHGPPEPRLFSNCIEPGLESEWTMPEDLQKQIEDSSVWGRTLRPENLE
jgi:hypothetical protein